MHEIQEWHDEGTDRLKDDDDAGGSADVQCCTTLCPDTINYDWTYAGDEEIDNTAEQTLCTNAMSTNECAVLNCKWTTSPSYSLITGPSPYTYKTIIFDWFVTTPTLVHEVGHWAGIASHPFVYKRIMSDI